MSDALVQWLRRPEVYPDATQGVVLVETHISWVFLTDQFAYKLKKPVRFDFLDFSTVELRRIACENEVRLNRRLAAHVYRGVVAVRRDERGGLFLDESLVGESVSSTRATAVVDWLVKMWRLPADRTLDALHRSGQLSADDLTRLAERLADFYRHTDRATMTAEEYRSGIARHVRANRSTLLAASRAALLATAGDQGALAASISTIKRIHAAQLQFLALKRGMFDARVAEGRVVDCHGDLRPEHFYLLPEPVAIDCIEFSAEFRRLDVADELSFLATECDFIEADEVGRQIADRCLTLLGDKPPAELMAFYRAYRACVRAKVAALRGKQVERGERQAALAQAARHLELAERYTMEFSSIVPSLLLVVHGLTGSGKSTLAAALADELGAESLSTDAVRRQMFGPSREPAAYGEGNYEATQRLAVYNSLFAAAEQHLVDRLSVVLDGTFLTAELRRRAAKLASRRGARPLFIHCSCPDEIARQRIAQRISAGGATSESRPELFDRRKADEEPTPSDLDRLDIQTIHTLLDQVDVVIDRLRDVYLRAR
jgi:aminoglycoside phosphotransferase family enzyme/predicted kinase